MVRGPRLPKIFFKEVGPFKKVLFHGLTSWYIVETHEPRFSLKKGPISSSPESSHAPHYYSNDTSII
jgi:hypothetical protein